MGPSSLPLYSVKWKVQFPKTGEAFFLRNTKLLVVHELIIISNGKHWIIKVSNLYLRYVHKILVKENVYPLNQRWLKKCIILIFSLKVACRVQIWKKTFCQNSDKFGYSFIKKDVTLGLFKIDTLNCTMYILTILTCSSKTYVIRLHNLISINIFFATKNIVFLYKCKEKAENK